MSSPYFSEPLCAVGGASCGAWADWFQACEDADPKAFDEERDPAPLAEHKFDAARCKHPETCPLYQSCHSN